MLKEYLAIFGAILTIIGFGFEVVSTFVIKDKKQKELNCIGIPLFILGLLGIGFSLVLA